MTELVAASNADAEPVDAETVDNTAAGSMPEVLALLADVIGEDETGIVVTADLAERIGWDPNTLGEALRRLEIRAPGHLGSGSVGASTRCRCSTWTRSSSTATAVDT
ncbi:hypothetical protein ACWEF6_21180 [Amycolatopsis sp. NPDC004772]